MAAVKVTTLEDLTIHLEDFLEQNEDAYQLDGRTTRHSNPAPQVIFPHQFDGGMLWFQLAGDTKVKAIKDFLELYRKNKGCLVPDETDVGRPALRLRSSPVEANGWQCIRFKGNPDNVPLSGACKPLQAAG